MNNDLINELNNKIDAQDKIINTQVLEIARLKEDKKKVWEWVIYKQQHSIEPYISTDELDEILEILGDKE